MNEKVEVRPTIRYGLYRHYKGNLYQVWGVARHSETGEWFVVYQKQYDDYGLFLRPYGMFVETVEIDGVIIPRFDFVTNGAVYLSQVLPEATDTGPDHYAGIFAVTPSVS